LGVPRVESVSCDQGAPPPFPITLYERVRRAGEATEFSTTVPRVGPNYFATMGIPIERGRDFVPRDFNRPPRDGLPVIVNETFARRYFSGADPLTQRVQLGADPDSGRPALIVEVVGVARDSNVRGGDAVPALFTPRTSTFLVV